MIDDPQVDDLTRDEKAEEMLKVQEGAAKEREDNEGYE
jgi:hypothetical protein